MIQHISGETPFQVLSKKFTISSSSSGYTLQFSADGLTWADKKAVAAGTPYEANGAMGAYWRLKGNTSDIVVNWRRDACGEGGGSSANVQESKSVTLTDNGTHEITPDDGYDAVAKVDATVNGALWLDTKISAYVIVLDEEEDVSPTVSRLSGVPALGFSLSFPNAKIADLQGLDFSNVQDTNGMFFGCSSLESINLQGLNFSNVQDTGSMFYNCSSLEAIDLQGLDFSNVQNANGMFYGCSSLESINLQGLNFSNVQDMSLMFKNCSKLKSLDLQCLDGATIDTGEDMCSECISLINVTMPRMVGDYSCLPEAFSGCGALQELTMPQGNNMIIRNLCASCLSLKKLDLSGLSILADPDASPSASFAYNCPSLTDVLAPQAISDNQDFSASTALTYESIKSLLYACSNAVSLSKKTCMFSRSMSDPDGELAALVTACAAKGWTITGLTLTD